MDLRLCVALVAQVALLVANDRPSRGASHTGWLVWTEKRRATSVSCTERRER